jgi:hypothetical protein
LSCLYLPFWLWLFSFFTLWLYAWMFYSRISKIFSDEIITWSSLFFYFFPFLFFSIFSLFGVKH